MAEGERRIYCIDTSSLLYAQHSFGDRPSRRATFGRVWEVLERLAGDGRLLAPHPVHGEITRGNDFIAGWCTDHPGIFRPKGEHAARVLEILREADQRLVDPMKPRGAEEADPWLIALAEDINATPPTLFDARQVGVVVSEERKAGGIGDICRRRRIQHMDLSELLAAEGAFGTR